MKLHSLASLSRLSGLDIRTLRQWRNAGLLLPDCRSGARLLYSEQALDAAKAKSLCGPQAAAPAAAPQAIDYTLIRGKFSARRRTTAQPVQRNNRNSPR